MKVSHFVALSILTLFFMPQVFSQSSYLEKGENGIGISGNYISDQAGKEIGGSFGMALNTFLDFGYSSAKVSLTQKLDGQDISAVVNSPYLTVTLFRQNDSIPVSCAVGAAYLDYKYSSPALSKLFITLEKTGISLDASMYGNIILSPTIKLQPLAGVNYVSVNAGTTATIVHLGLSLLIKTGDSMVIGVTPSVGLDKGNNEYELNAAIVFPF